MSPIHCSIRPGNCLLLLLALTFSATLLAREARASDMQQRLGTVTSWHYQLQNIDVAALSQLDVDLIFIDDARSSPEVASPVELTREEVELLRKRPDGGRRIVLAYLSIGEAEEYRFYWKAEFAKVRPAWHAARNNHWPDNHRVRFWMDAWKEIIVRRSGSYLDRIQDAGFDGVYLDRVDVYASLAREQPDARYLAEFQYRFNRRFKLPEMLNRLASVATRAAPRPYKTLKILHVAG